MSRASDLAAIDDYLAGHMPDDEAERFEEALFEAAASGAEGGALRFLDGVARIGAHLAARGVFDFGITQKELDALRAAGYRIAEHTFGPPGAYTMPYPSLEGVDLFVSRYEVDARGYDRIDVEIELPDAGVVKTIRDVRIDPEDGNVYACCDVRLMRMVLANPRTISRVVVERDGRRSLFGVYDVRVVDG